MFMKKGGYYLENPATGERRKSQRAKQITEVEIFPGSRSRAPKCKAVIHSGSGTSVWCNLKQIRRLMARLIYIHGNRYGNTSRR